MRTLGVIVNERCNIRCSYCFNHTHDTVVQPRARNKVANTIDKEFIGAVVSELCFRNYSSISISGGEPTVSPNTIFWLKETGLKNIHAIVVTNLVRLTTDFLDAFSSHPNITVRVSLGGTTEASHNIDRQCFSETMQNLKKLLANDIRCEISFVLTPDNFEELPALEKLSSELNCGVHLSPLSDTDRPSLSTVHASEWERVLDLLRKPSLIRELWIARAYYLSQSKLHSCMMRTHGHILDPRGTLFGCFFRRDIQFGNLIDEGISTVLNRAISNEVLSAPCFGSHCLGMLTH